MRRALAIGALFLSAVGCRGSTAATEPPGPNESPQAKAEPAPLTNSVVPTASAQPALVNSDAGPPPVAMRGDIALPADSVSKERETTGWSMQAVLRTGDPPALFKPAEASAQTIEAVRKKTEPRLSIDLSLSHARIVLASQGFPLPEDTELRARADRYGFVVVLPGPPVYRIAAPGTLRALLGERRIDVTPLAGAELIARGDGPRKLGMRTRKVEVVNRAAVATFEIAHLADVGEGGALVCRALLDLMNAPPSTPVCGLDDVPLHAELRWTTHGSFVFDATAFARRQDLTPQLLGAPPPSATYSLPALPFVPAQLLVSAIEIGAFRTTAADVPAPRASDPPAGLAIANSTDELRFLWLDGVPVAWLGPGAREMIPTLLHGRYTLAWRTFLGDAIDPPQTITVPGTSDPGAPDAGAAR